MKGGTGPGKETGAAGWLGKRLRIGVGCQVNQPVPSGGGHQHTLQKVGKRFPGAGGGAQLEEEGETGGKKTVEGH